MANALEVLEKSLEKLLRDRFPPIGGNDSMTFVTVVHDEMRRRSTFYLDATVAALECDAKSYFCEELGCRVQHLSATFVLSDQDVAFNDLESIKGKFDAAVRSFRAVNFAECTG